ncbi:LL-diaminopimelate aminotransferase [Paenibacillus chitinolyticus]|uniref:LL-diaminopimelate aminotransferase n=1 Tax=Paenibacillus chitinolyticus TaxID=79263 RepID=UPI001C459E9D|nr:LL-diaminopimelate aminotransferase [Paenibacillus chitinolyticus]MBV6713923.1 LL-diaminopimelate aminotransferase [Paenibacillus chitinolyticus]
MLVLQDYIQKSFANRIGGDKFGKGNEVYKFEKIKRAKAQALKEKPGIPIIDMGLGEPDWMADKEVVNVLSTEAAKRENRFYSDNGSFEFKEAAAAYMERIYGVKGLDPTTEINHCIGSKPALAQIPAVFINPGDITLMTVPGYPVIGTHTQWLGGEVVKMPLLEENGYLPDLNALSDEVKKRAKLLYLNYPNNPTGAVATRAFYEEVVRFAKENEIIVVSDEAYAALTFDGEPPLSFLSVPGAKDVGIAIQSLSKAFNMTGWRLGFVAGNELVLKAFSYAKDNHDSGQFLAIQKAGIYCLNHPEITEATAAKYSRRHGLLAEALGSVGFKVRKPKATFYLYAQAPKGIEDGPRFDSAEDFSQYLITEKLISTVPWDDAGAYVRFSVTFEAEGEEEERALIDELKSRLHGLRYIW